MNHAIINTCSGRARSSAAERAAHNRLVAGSNPAGPTDIFHQRIDYQDRSWLHRGIIFDSRVATKRLSSNEKI
jgi:hypothetical protein